RRRAAGFTPPGASPAARPPGPGAGHETKTTQTPLKRAHSKTKTPPGAPAARPGRGASPDPRAPPLPPGTPPRSSPPSSPAPAPRHPPRGARRPVPRRTAPALQLEQLEGRSLPSTFTVQNLHDAGPGSLRQAVLDANAHPGPDAIRFAHGLHGTIALTGGELS